MEQEKIKELMSNEAFVKDLFESESYEAAQDKFKAEGVDVSIDELKTAVTLLKKKADGELNDEDLEDISGGSGLIALGVFYGIAAVTTAVGGGFAIAKMAKSC